MDANIRPVSPTPRRGKVARKFFSSLFVDTN